MAILLDTHTLLWCLFEPEKLSEKARDYLFDADDAVLFSAVSLWEIEIKHLRRPESMPFSSSMVLEAAQRCFFEMLPLKPNHIEELKHFVSQGIHKDPFDHLLLASSKAERIPLLTHDSVLPTYHNVLVERC